MVKLSSPFMRVNFDLGTMKCLFCFLWQMEQLQLYTTSLFGAKTSNLMASQWQPPVWSVSGVVMVPAGMKNIYYFNQCISTIYRISLFLRYFLFTMYIHMYVKLQSKIETFDIAITYQIWLNDCSVWMIIQLSFNLHYATVLIKLNFKKPTLNSFKSKNLFKNLFFILSL